MCRWSVAARDGYPSDWGGMRVAGRAHIAAAFAKAARAVLARRSTSAARSHMSVDTARQVQGWQMLGGAAGHSGAAEVMVDREIETSLKSRGALVAVNSPVGPLTDAVIGNGAEGDSAARPEPRPFQLCVESGPEK
jgi:hypothetical protein